jgi:hypothetical protein
MNHCLHLIGSEGNFLTQTDENFNEKVNNEKSNFPRHHDSDLRARNGGPFTDGFSRLAHYSRGTLGLWPIRI